MLKDPTFLAPKSKHKSRPSTKLGTNNRRLSRTPPYLAQAPNMFKNFPDFGSRNQTHLRNKNKKKQSKRLQEQKTPKKNNKHTNINNTNKFSRTCSHQMWMAACIFLKACFLLLFFVFLFFVLLFIFLCCFFVFSWCFLEPLALLFCFFCVFLFLFSLFVFFVSFLIQNSGCPYGFPFLGQHTGMCLLIFVLFCAKQLGVLAFFVFCAKNWGCPCFVFCDGICGCPCIFCFCAQIWGYPCIFCFLCQNLGMSLHVFVFCVPKFVDLLATFCFFVPSSRMSLVFC